MRRSFLVFTVLLFVSCMTVDKVYREPDLIAAQLSGVVIDESGLPLEGAKVVLNDVLTSITDINGKYYFTMIKLGRNQIKVTKKDYSEFSTTFDHSMKRKAAFYLKVKLVSVHYLLNTAEELLIEKKYHEIPAVFEQIERIDATNRGYKYASVIYLYMTGKIEEAVKILEPLREEDRYNEVYSLTLLKLYEDMKWYRKAAMLAEWMHEYKIALSHDHLAYAMDIYQNKLQDLESYARIKKLHEERADD